MVFDYFTAPGRDFPNALEISLPLQPPHQSNDLNDLIVHCFYFTPMFIIQ